MLSAAGSRSRTSFTPAARKASFRFGVATVTPVSVKIHLGVNVTGEGAPVEAAGLEDLGVDPEAFARDLLASYAAEIEGARASRAKVRGVD